jgi:hypothetical protein
MLDRRSFLRLASATAALFTQKARPQATSPARAPRAGRTATTARKNFVGIHVRGFAWVDEGIDQVLDNIQHKGGDTLRDIFAQPATKS